MSAVHDQSSKGDHQGLKNKDKDDDHDEESGSKDASEYIDLVVKLSSIDEVENSHHHKDIEAVGFMSRRT